MKKQGPSRICLPRKPKGALHGGFWRTGQRGDRNGEHAPAPIPRCSRRASLAAFEAFVAKRTPKYPRLAAWSERAGHVPASCEFPPGLRRLVYTNNRV